MSKKTMSEGDRRYCEYRDKQMADAKFRAIYEEEAAKKELWMQLVVARQAAGLTQAELAKRLGVSQAQVARLEKKGYEDYTLNSLRRYVEALGAEFRLEVKVRRSEEKPQSFASTAVSR
jgi:predicted XRE-type DNA-binding protein